MAGLLDGGDAHGEFVPPSTTKASLGASPAPPAPAIFDEVTLAVSGVPAHPASPSTTGLPEIPGFKLVREIGRGGMGVVWEAIQLSLDRKVALKTLSAELSGGEDSVARFERETTALARLSHPNLVMVIDRGRAGDLYYFAMEYIESAGGGPPTDLREVMRSGNLNSTRILEIVTQICKALASAHKQGIVHRDIKPSNILIDTNGDVRIVDFGIAAMSRTRVGEPVHLTVAGTSMGTPAYMAPEQKTDAGDVDHRADVFSVGILIYELLTGHLPYGSFERPSELLPGLNPKWDGLVERATRPSVDRRFASMEELLEALAAISEARISTPLHGDRERSPASTVVQPWVSGRCPRCSKATPTDRQYCPHCGANLRETCPKCGFEQPVWEDFCSDCGANRVELRKAARYLETAKQEFKLVSELAGQPIQRFESLEKAYINTGRALKSAPENIEAAHLLQEIEAVRQDLAIVAAEHAMQNRELGAASQLCRIVIEGDPDNSRMHSHLEDIETMRGKMIEQARLLRSQGGLRGSCRILSEAIRYFPTDQEVQTLHKEAANELHQVETTVKARIPELRKARKYIELAQILQDMHIKGIQVRGLPEASQNVQKVLERARQLQLSAKTHLTLGRYAEAQRLAKGALDLVADLKEAESVWAEATAHRTEQDALTLEIKKAMAAEQWFTARSLLRTFLQAWPKCVMAATMLQTVDGHVTRETKSLRLLAWNVVGAVLWITAGMLTVSFCDTLQQASFSTSFGNVHSQQFRLACEICFHCLLAGGLLLGLINISQNRWNWRPIAWMALAPLAALVTVVVPYLLPVVDLAGVLGPNTQKGQYVADMLVAPVLGYALNGLLLGAMVCVAVGQVGVGLAFSWFARGLVCTAAWSWAMSWPIESGSVSIGSFIAWFCIGCAGASGLGAVGLTRGLRCYLILASVFVFCYGIRHGIGFETERDASDWLHFPLDVTWAIIVGVAVQVFLGGQQRLPGRIVAGLLCAGLWFFGLNLDARTSTWTHHLILWGLIWAVWADALRRHLGTELTPRIPWMDIVSATLRQRRRPDNG